ncbi:TPA: hypothetical protein DDW69_00845 [candidate division CPR2 bacterium]|uniref:ATP synthase gamma chain n=1 Tax=candidate division CPR2 bacterium GW2011_GWC1_41_48 TaxID=1618344 RepID=A0A0G0WA05_UNCC2|nr:MAG: ATP synthase gamma chain [candidate division CPR2 bacterium GW2011_GWC2_39_35]KKR27294.1 MAG: ATP synthase gamma chain [candidate division CPR2 bacterium GW2011_GWD1_39_7]KKR28079.1 MAG: ATP synthase gamma chain [candidate division CPR2 bacterium GW2011_GWD2_39_7]KKS08882.1 MAG: ATP synthase gamma chain [candidate division CPR2 bacterium GW2011_GWC1_41_48]OGB57970.1 MAG: hypothetical protein A2Y27_00170 [candidate division CPR2 bacterium GWD1_39_7]OGB72175.1 MAG: hypothetical protein A
MSAINEVKEQIGVVRSVGDFTTALQQIGAMRMMSLRNQVLQSKRFVDEATQILRELKLYREILYKEELERAEKRAFKKRHKEEKKESKEALIIITSNQGLCGSYNSEIFKALETHILRENQNADIFMVGKKGQEHYLMNKKYNFKFYPYNIPDNFSAADLLRLAGVFSHYDKILMVYSRYINTITRDVVETLLVTPPTESKEGEEANVPEEEKVKFLFEPSIEELIMDVSSKLRAAAFQQQILDSRLSQFSAQMVGMQTASENAKTMLEDLDHEYNKQRRKMIDKKISEVFAGSALW